METTHSRVKRIKVKKPKKPSFKSRLERLIKKGYLSNSWLYQILIFSTLLFFIVGVFLVLWYKPLAADWKGGVLDKKPANQIR